MTWEQIAHQLAEALRSFTAYDGLGEGGADDSNKGDWEMADRAMINYETKVAS